MRASYLQSEHLLPGRIVAWRPKQSREELIAASSIDHTPLTADQGEHVETNRQLPLPSPDGSAPWIGFSCVLRDSSTDSIAQTWAQYFDRHEGLRWMIGVERSDENRVIAPGVLSFEPVVIAETHSTDETHEVVSAYLAEQANCAQWPYAGIVTIDSGVESMLVAGFDHVVFDGYSMYLAASEVPALHDEIVALMERAAVIDSSLNWRDENVPAEPVGIPVAAPADSVLAFAVHEHQMVSGVRSNDPALRAWRRMITPAQRGQDARIPGPPSATGIAADGRYDHGFTSIALTTREETEEYVTAMRAAGQSVAMSMVGALSHAIISLEPDNRVDMLMSTHNRRRPGWFGSIGWFAGVAPMTIITDDPNSLLTTVQATTDAWHDAELAGVIRLPQVGRLLRADMEPGLVVSYMDSRRAPGWRTWEANRACALLGPVAPSAQLHLWVNQGPAGTFLEARFPQTHQCAEWLIEVAATMQRLMLNSASDRSTSDTVLAPTPS